MSMQFGNWKVTDKAIEWNGKGLNRFVIPKETLTTVRRYNTDEPGHYEWILLATDEDWLTQGD